MGVSVCSSAVGSDQVESSRAHAASRHPAVHLASSYTYNKKAASGGECDCGKKADDGEDEENEEEDEEG